MAIFLDWIENASKVHSLASTCAMYLCLDDGKDKGKGGGAKAPAGPVDSIPCTFEEWSLYEMPEDIRQMCREDVSGFCPNALTFNKPVSLKISRFF